MKDFQETTEEKFLEALNCLPPLRWTRSKNIEFFFMGEPYSDNIYICYVRKQSKYFSALIPITTPTVNLINLDVG
jgi:hypothetical protein